MKQFSCGEILPGSISTVRRTETGQSFPTADHHLHHDHVTKAASQSAKDVSGILLREAVAA